MWFIRNKDLNHLTLGNNLKLLIDWRIANERNSILFYCIQFFVVFVVCDSLNGVELKHKTNGNLLSPFVFIGPMRAFGPCKLWTGVWVRVCSRGIGKLVADNTYAMDKLDTCIILDSDDEDEISTPTLASLPVPAPASVPVPVPVLVPSAVPGPSQPSAANVRPINRLPRRQNYYENTYENSEYMPESVRRRKYIHQII